jgi:hypothetical protein
VSQTAEAFVSPQHIYSARKPSSDHDNIDPDSAYCHRAAMGRTDLNAPDLPAGSVDLLVLQALLGGPRHGYAIAQHIHDLSGDVLALGGRIDMTRPLCRHPQRALYKGTGRTNDAANYTCKVKGCQPRPAGFEVSNRIVARTDGEF